MIIVTTVGSSVFRKIIEKDNNFKREYHRIMTSKTNLRPANKYVDNGIKSHIEGIEKEMTTYRIRGEEYSAEIKSIERLIKENPDEEMFDVYLICSDTVESVVAADFIKKFYNGKKNVNIHFDLPDVNSLIKNPDSIYFDPNCSKSIEHCIVKGLQVFESDRFEKEGMNYFFDALLKIRSVIGAKEKEKKEKKKILFDITGGYKAIIPYMVLFAEVFDIPIFYIFEHSDELIRIPQLPVEFDYSILEQNYTALSQLGKNKQITASDLLDNFLPVGEGKKIIENLKDKGIITEENNSIIFTPVGRAIWERFKELKKDNVVNKIAANLIELKLFEHFVNKYPHAKIEHSKNIEAENGKKFEIDVYIETNNAIIACEVKPGGNIPIWEKDKENTIEKNIKEGAFRNIYSIYSNKKNGIKKIDLRIYLYTTYSHLAQTPIEDLRKLKEKYKDISPYLSFYLIKVPENYKTDMRWKINGNNLHKINNI